MDFLQAQCVDHPALGLLQGEVVNQAAVQPQQERAGLVEIFGGAQRADEFPDRGVVLEYLVQPIGPGIRTSVGIRVHRHLLHHGGGVTQGG